MLRERPAAQGLHNDDGEAFERGVLEAARAGLVLHVKEAVLQLACAMIHVTAR